MLAGLCQFRFLHRTEENRYVPETDPLVLEKLEKWQDLEIRSADALGTLQSVGSGGILVNLLRR